MEQEINKLQPLAVGRSAEQMGQHSPREGLGLRQSFMSSTLNYVVAEDSPSVTDTDPAGLGLPHILIIIHSAVLHTAASLLCTKGWAGEAESQGRRDVEPRREKERGCRST